ncbi:MAG: lysostaphin resistance A-like protein [Sandaracinaceae bacterium]
MRPGPSLSVLDAVLWTGLGVVGAYLAAALLGLPLVLGGASPLEAWTTVRADLGSRTLALAAGLGFATALAVRSGDAGCGSVADALGLTPTPLAVGALAVTAGLAVHLPTQDLVARLLTAWPEMRPDPAAVLSLRRALAVETALDTLRVPLVAVVLPAVSEELFFRGVLTAGLARRHGGTLAVVVSAVLFALIHATPLRVAYALPLGALLGVLRLGTGSTVPAIAMHGAFNAMPVLVHPDLVRLPHAAGGLGPGVLSPTLSLAALAVAALAFLGALWIGRDAAAGHGPGGE